MFALRHSDESSSSSDDECADKSPVNKKRQRQEQPPRGSGPENPTSGTRKWNNVWGQIALDQALSEDISGVMKDKQKLVNRESESYDRTLALTVDKSKSFETDTVKQPVVKGVHLKTTEDFLNEVPPIYSGEAEGNQHLITVSEDLRVPKRTSNGSFKANRGRGRGGRADTGFGQSRNFNRRDRELRHIDESIAIQPDELTDKIVKSFREPKRQLFSKIVQVLGVSKAIELYNSTVDIENSGGMLVLTGCRRKTPGGVFIQQIKDDPSLPTEELNKIWEEDRLQDRVSSKGKRRRQKILHPTPTICDRLLAGAECSEPAAPMSQQSEPSNSTAEIEEGEMISDDAEDK